MGTSARPRILQTVLDAEDPRALAEFYRELFGLRYRPGDEPAPNDPDRDDWVVLVDDDGRRALAFQGVARLPRSTWPSAEVPQQLHLDSTVPDAEELVRQRDRVIALGGTLAFDRFDDPDEPLYVFVDPAGHPFCIFVG